MHGLPTIHQMNRDNEEAARIMAKYDTLTPPSEAEQTSTRLSAAERVTIAQDTMKRILNGARG